PMTDGDDLNRDVLRHQIHYQRRQHIGGVDLAGNERLFDLRPTVVPFVFEVRQGDGSVETTGHAGDRKRKVAGDGQAGYFERLESSARAETVAEQIPIDVEPHMEGGDPAQPSRHSEEDAARGF